MRRIDYYLEGRLFEWIMTLSMLLLAFQIWLYPTTVVFSAFKDLLDIMTAQFIGLFMLTVGLMRAAALTLNGHSINGVRLGPLFRSLMAVFCATMWFQFAFALLQLSITKNNPSPGLPFWTMFVLGELYVAYKAVRKNA